MKNSFAMIAVLLGLIQARGAEPAKTVPTASSAARPVSKTTSVAPKTAPTAQRRSKANRTSHRQLGQPSLLARGRMNRAISSPIRGSSGAGSTTGCVM